MATATHPKIKSTCALIEYDVDGKVEKLAWGFSVNPKDLSFSDGAEYGKIAAINARVPSRFYQNGTGTVLQISDLVIDVFCSGKNLLSEIEGLQSLLECKLDSYEPPKVLMFRWGNRKFAPCILTKIDWKEEKFVVGKPAKIRLNITLEEIPRPLTKAELAQRDKLKQQAIADRRTQLDKPALKLTDRQAKVASDRAEEYLQENKDQFSPEVQSLIAQKFYQLRTNSDTGEVEMYSGSKNLGVVIKMLGENQFRGGDKITTIPVKKGGKLTELK